MSDQTAEAPEPRDVNDFRAALQEKVRPPNEH